MPETDKSTPRPWRVDATKALGAYGVWTEAADPRNPGHDGAGYPVQICSMQPAERLPPREERDANAALIVRAVNLHGRLIETCGLLLDRLEREGSGKPETWAAIDSARKLLAEAKEQP